MLNLSARMRDTVNTTKIQDFMSKTAVRILVGFPSGLQHVGSSTGDEEPIATAVLAEKLHYGADGIPARPFLEEGIATKQQELTDELKRQTENLKNNGQANFNKIGTMAVGAVQEFVRGDHYKSSVPNSPATIAAKGSDKPLIDTGEMLNSLTFVVEGKK